MWVRFFICASKKDLWKAQAAENVFFCVFLFAFVHSEGCIVSGRGLSVWISCAGREQDSEDPE